MSGSPNHHPGHRSHYARLVLIAVTVHALVSCGSERLPDPLTRDEANALDIEQGIAGRAAMRTGNCVSGCTESPFGACSVEPVPFDLVVLPAEPALLEPDVPAEGCAKMSAAHFGRMHGFRLPAESPSPVARISLRTRLYTLALDPGEYQLVLMDGAGCVYCVGSNRGMDGYEAVRCNSVTVTPEEVTPVSVFLDTASH